MADWTPTDEQVRAQFGALPEPFDRWLAAHDAEVRARALTEAADALEGRLGIAGTPRDLWEFREWLRARAEQIGDDR